MYLLTLILAFIADFFITAFGLWIISVVLNTFGIAIAFSWSAAFGIWVIIKVIKILF